MIERGGNTREEIRKGPWKAEEDEVLLKHVRKYGPRDWSSIRSKGLLHRTGKSCRLRWVNKLRPNLKNGCKFTGEEERIVIELQAQFGNKWARIATYLPGRTDNDVKNFWSSRQKRLARILQASASSSSSSSSKSLRTKPRDVPTAPRDDTGQPMEIAPLRSWRDEPDQPRRRPHLPDNSNTITPAVLPESEVPASLLHEKPICSINSQGFFPQIPQDPQSGGMSFLPEANDFLGRLEDSSLFSTFETLGSITGLGETDEIPLFELPGCFRTGNLDTFFDDFPTDMLDNVGSPASPPRP